MQEKKDILKDTSTNDENAQVRLEESPLKKFQEQIKKLQKEIKKYMDMPSGFKIN